MILIHVLNDIATNVLPITLGGIRKPVFFVDPKDLTETAYVAYALGFNLIKREVMGFL
jgi:hypothetical protein